MKMVIIILLNIFIMHNIVNANNKIDKFDRFMIKNFDFFSDKIFPETINSKKKIVIKQIENERSIKQYEYMYWTEILKFYSPNKSNYLMDIDDLSIIRNYVSAKRNIFGGEAVSFSIQKFDDFYKLGNKYRLYSIVYEFHNVLVMLKIDDNKIIRVGYMMGVFSKN